ncbi:MAG: ATP-dependent sacrificial sulfur transferase LarE [Blautia sp.]|nr:ATP-dependent sacrificial sulfur transferase LarE [Blautia sp.]
MDYDEKKRGLLEWAKAAAEENMILAYSGGVDSSLLLKILTEAAKHNEKKVYAVLFQTELHPVREALEAEALAKECGALYEVISCQGILEAGIEKNPMDRCYRCKSFLFDRILDRAGELGIRTIVEGTNYDDLFVYRPGIKAIRERQVISPLAGFEMTKEDVRRMAGEYGIRAGQKPSTPCLATRLPYGDTITPEKLRQIEEAEQILRNEGFYNVRVRMHGNIARLEIDEEHFLTLMKDRRRVIGQLKKLGFRYVTLDLEGFRSGSMDLSG